MLFGILEMKEFAESSNDDRIKAMWRQIENSRSRSAKWCDAYTKVLRVLGQIAASPVDLVNDGECCMRVKSVVLVEAKVLAGADAGRA